MQKHKIKPWRSWHWFLSTRTISCRDDLVPRAGNVIFRLAWTLVGVPLRPSFGYMPKFSLRCFVGEILFATGCPILEGLNRNNQALDRAPLFDDKSPDRTCDNECV